MSEEFASNEFAIDVLCDENGFVALPFRCLEEEGLEVDWGGEAETLSKGRLFLAEHRYPESKTWHRIVIRCDDWSKVWMVAIDSSVEILSRLAPQNAVSKARHCTWRFLTPLPKVAGMLVYDWTELPCDADDNFIVRDFETTEAPNSLEHSMCFFGKIEEIPHDFFSNIEASSFKGAFQGCIIKCSIPYSLFSKQGSAKSFASCFEEVEFKVQFPLYEEMFGDCTSAENFTGLFRGSNLNYIPEGLFKGCKAAKSYKSCFSRTRIKEIPNVKLFGDSPEAENFSFCFNGCHEIEVAPSRIFSGTNGKDFSYCFANCTQLETVEAPFVDCSNAENFFGCFKNCSSLLALSGVVFLSAGKATDFGECFEGCEKLATVSDTLFQNTHAAENFDAVFKDCKGIKSLPKGLFSKCPNAAYFNASFMNCISLDEIAADIFRGCKEAEEFESTFQGCINLFVVPVTLFAWCENVITFKKCFDGCINAFDSMKLYIASSYVADASYFVPSNATFLKNAGTVVLIKEGTKTERTFMLEERKNPYLKIETLHA